MSKSYLFQKLGLHDDQKRALLFAPEQYLDELVLVEPGYFIFENNIQGKYDWIQAFYTSKDQLASDFSYLQKHLQKTGQLWISWPKKTSVVTSDLNDDKVRQIGLENGLVDIKIASINSEWSALKFVYRLSDR